MDIGGAVAPGYSACIQCTTSLEALGALAADIALADAGAKTDVAVASDPAISPLKAEVDGVKQEIAKNGDGSQVLDIQQSVSATPADNAARIVSFLQRNPSVKYVIASQQFQPGAALNSAGLGSRVKLVGMYPLNATNVASVKDGQILAYSVGELASLYWRAADAAARAVQGVTMDPIAPIQSLRVMDKTNADISLLDPRELPGHLQDGLAQVNAARLRSSGRCLRACMKAGCSCHRNGQCITPRARGLLGGGRGDDN